MNKKESKPKRQSRLLRVSMTDEELAYITANLPHSVKKTYFYHDAIMEKIARMQGSR